MWGPMTCTFSCVLHSVKLGIRLLLILTIVRQVNSVQYDLLSICIVLSPMLGARGLQMRQGLCP